MISVIYFIGAMVTYLVWASVIHRKFFSMSLSYFSVMFFFIALWPIGLPVLFILLREKK